VKQKMIERGVRVYSQARAANFTAQYLALDWLAGKWPSAKKILRRSDPKTISRLMREIDRLLMQDAKIFANGVLPLRFLLPENPLNTIANYPRLIWDGIKVYQRRNANTTDHFPEATSVEELDSLPEYYRRNFHFQTDGYMSNHSARLYDHQVDLLFSGTSDAMRRMLVQPVHQFAKKRNALSGKGLRILEIGCGSGSATRILAALLPEAHVTAIDLSSFYVEHGKSRLRKHRNVHFLQANAESLPFKNEQFDIVLSVFMFHELPLAVRERVLKEAHRVTAPEGRFVAIDSVQKGDSEVFNELLDDFPKNYHEPFFKNYVQHPMSVLIEKAGFKNRGFDIGFASKCWIADR
jgi:ubiquinone/menaquinone biosynthesis C-methylase UbiE